MSAIVFMCAFVASVQQLSAQTLPSGWTSRDINSSGGSAASSNGTWTISGSGDNIWGSADGFQFTYRTISGDFDVTTRLAALDAANEWSKAGVMVRETLNANAKNAFAMFSPGTGPALQYRSETGGTTARVTGSGGTVPTWLRLARQGTKFTAYTSTTGVSWTAVGSATISIASTVYVGFAVTARDIANLSEATFTNVQIQQNQAGTTESAASAGSTWTSTDIGSPALAGSFSSSSGTYTITGAGSDIWGTTDQFRYTYQTLTGDVELIARVASLQLTSPWAKAGVMIRQSTDPRAPYAMMEITGTEGFRFQRRTALAAASYEDYVYGAAAPGWVKLTREGNLFSAYYSTDGSNWSLLGTDTFNLGSTVLVGMAVTSHYTSATTTAQFTNVTARSLTAGSNQPPSVTLTAPSASATYSAPATVSMGASATDSDGTISRVDFYRGSTLVASDTTSPYTATWSSAPAGSYALTAVAYDNQGAATTSAPVNITIDSATGQAPIVSFISPIAGATYTAPADIYVAAAASDADGTISRVDLYQGSTLLKADSTSPYSFSWTSVPAGTYQLTATAHDNTGSTRSTTISITVNSAGGNQAPSVSLTSPSNGAAYAALATVNLAANASDSDGTISRVEFYRGTTLIATDTTSPYTASWSSAPAGSYSLTARAYDNSGGSRTSTAVNITVGSSNQLPTVSITSPTSATSLLAPATITIAATATDPDGTISGVDFYVGTQLIGTDTTSPYTASWTNVAAGAYSLTARARDNAGASTTSAAVAVTVSPASTNPTRVVFTASVNHNTTVISYMVALYRSVDPVTASPVATRDIGKPTPTNGEISADITTLVNPLPTGSYYAVVRSVGTGGSSASTPSATFSK